MSEFIRSSASSVLASTLTYPISVVKTQYQIGAYNNTMPNRFKLTNIISIVNNVRTQQGLSGFYRGYGAFVTTYPLFWGFYFQTRDSSKLTYFENPHINNAISSYVSGIIGGTLTNPLLVLKTRRQAAILKGYQAPYRKMVTDIYRNEGIPGFYKGLASTFVFNVKFGLQFPLYDAIKERYDNVAVASFGAKFVTSTLFYPFDLVRVNQRNSEVKLSTLQSMKHIYRQSGVRGFYNGVSLYVLLTAPNFIIMMVVYDRLKSLFIAQ